MLTIDQQIELWIEEAQRQFAFLTSLDYEVHSVRPDVAWGRVTYLGNKLGVRLEVELGPFFMYLALFRPEYPEHDNSKYLRACLQCLGLSCDWHQQVLSLRDDFEHFQSMVEIYANALRANLITLEASVNDLFPQ